MTLTKRNHAEVWNQPVRGSKAYSTSRLPCHSGSRVDAEADDPAEPADPEAEAESEQAADFFRSMFTLRSSANAGHDVRGRLALAIHREVGWLLSELFTNSTPMISPASSSLRM
ncbi:hypothetical protein PHYPSEUDO_011958 [Phytophthora pseudosyringae]|uniref:Uncharacterized protein n=1 Tax=Phytophthora pseudosyringae TaxID=221518 RepID=A0A8T1VAF9_9STRA|nr:hypothetical protein PHYPSEUDO_011958 [Phytophthora pseudosyringae]